MKEYSVRVIISAECVDDLIERLEDRDNPIERFFVEEIREVKK